jgi:uncharacterized protein RhaS with RHS repeats
MYHAGLGRFMGRDPIGYFNGLNQYHYVRGKPARYADPLGYAECDCPPVCCQGLTDLKDMLNQMINQIIQNAVKDKASPTAALEGGLGGDAG